MNEILAALLAAVLGSSVTHLLERRESQSKIEEVKKSYMLPPQIPSEDQRNAILLVGLGGSGKTSLIRSLLLNPKANPNEKTGEFAIYSGQRSSQKQGNQDNSNIKYWFFIADYLGQNLGQLVRSFLIQQKKQYSPFAYGHITSLILVVDLLPPLPNNADPEPQQPDPNRVNKHNLEWNDTALDAVFGLLTKELKYVCLFINKSDLMADNSTGSDKNYMNLFKDLAERMKIRCNNAKFEVMLGSAKYGNKITDLSFRLMKFSVD